MQAREEEEYFFKERIKLFLKILQMLMAVVGLISLVRLSEHNYCQSLIDMFFFFSILISYLVLKNDHGKYKIVTRIIFLLAIITAVFTMINQPDNPIRFIWLTTVTYMVFYLFERKEATYWIGIITVFLSLLFLFNIEGFQISRVNFLIWILNISIILLIAHWYAKIEEESTQKLLQIKDFLADEVVVKTRELREKKNELEEKTKQLQRFNKDLEEKIKEKITKIREEEQMLFRQARYAQMGEMISMIAHQWRQPLNAISATTTAMQLKIEMNTFDPETFTEHTRMLTKYTQHLSMTIDDFRNFFKQDKIKKLITPEEIIENALTLAGGALQNKHIAVKREYNCNSSIHTYPNEVIHVILNLIKNAQDALVENTVTTPQIIIRTYCQETRLYIEVEDNAGGIKSTIIKKIFDPYFTTKENSDGTGLGLYMSKIIIEDHCQGSIEAHNGTQGALIKLSLPFHRSPKTEKEKQDA